MAESFNNFGKIADALPVVCGQIVRKTAFDCQANIQSFIRSNGQIDTGFMVNSVYTVTSEGSTYNGGADALPEVGGADQTTAYVAVAANYAVYQNYGTRFQPGKPFFEPGIEQTRPGFEAACSALEEKLRGMVH